jgi:hypothetical protein
MWQRNGWRFEPLRATPISMCVMCIVLFNFLKFKAQIEMYNLMDIDFTFKEKTCEIWSMFK